MHALRCYTPHIPIDINHITLHTCMHALRCYTPYTFITYWCTYMCMHTYAHTYMHDTRTHIHTCIHTSIHVWHTYIHTCIHYIDTYITYIFMHTYIQWHTHTHTHIAYIHIILLNYVFFSKTKNFWTMFAATIDASHLWPCPNLLRIVCSYVICLLYDKTRL